jgi:nucleoside-diphosphate-sugar epimerase
MKLRVIITGATGMVGEGVLLECLLNPQVEKVLIVNRKHYDLQHPKLQELIVPDFMKLDAVKDQLKGYDACFFCAGISSVGMKEEDFRRVTYDVTLNFARTLSDINPNMTFIYVSGAGTDSSEQGRLMWARVKGKTENDLMKLPFKNVFPFRPGFMKPFPEQKNLPSWFKFLGWLFPIVKALSSNSVSTMQQVGRAMIAVSLNGYSKKILEISDINSVSNQG